MQAQDTWVENGCLCSAGGVVLATKDGKIVLENTLESRLEVVFKQQLPEVGFLLVLVMFQTEFTTCLR